MQLAMCFNNICFFLCLLEILGRDRNNSATAHGFSVDNTLCASVIEIQSTERHIDQKQRDRDAHIVHNSKVMNRMCTMSRLNKSVKYIAITCIFYAFLSVTHINGKYDYLCRTYTIVSAQFHVFDMNHIDFMSVVVSFRQKMKLSTQTPLTYTRIERN